MTLLRGPARDALRLASLDDLVAAYHRPSGTTHVLATPAPEILDALADAPLTPAQLLGALQLDEQDASILAARVDELVRAGLIIAG